MRVFVAAAVTETDVCLRSGQDMSHFKNVGKLSSKEKCHRFLHRPPFYYGFDQF